MKVQIKTVNNEQHEIEFDSEVTTLVSHLKELIYAKTSVEVERQRLIFRGKVLQDGSNLEGYNLEENAVIHFVVRPVNFRELQQQASSVSTTQQLQRSAPLNPITSVTSQSFSPIANPLPSSSAVGNITAASEAEITAASTATVTPPRESASESSIEHIRQNLLTVNTLLSTMDRDTVEGHHSHPEGFRRFYVGQWLDVKDTVNQWLEATILQVDREGNRIFVHYNGWPARWDEWIFTNSPRIAPFRSRTNHSTLNVSLSPNPNIIANHAPSTGPNDIRAVVPELARVVSVLNSILQDLSAASIENLQRAPNGNFPASASPDHPWDNIFHNPPEESYQPRGDNTANDEHLKALYREACPLLDRVGRTMADVSTHMWNFVEPGAIRPNQNNRPIDPMGSFESRIMSLLRERPPSPPPMRAYRAPITAAAHRNDGQDMFRSPASLLSFLASNQALSRASGNDHQVDIQIAILPTTTLVSGSSQQSSTMNSTVANLTSTLQSQVQQLAQRTQELTERTNAVTQLSSALRNSIQARIAESQVPEGLGGTETSEVESQSNLAIHGGEAPSEPSSDFSIAGSSNSDVSLSENLALDSVVSESDSDGSHLEDLVVRNTPSESQTLIPGQNSTDAHIPYFNAQDNRIEPTSGHRSDGREEISNHPNSEG